MSRQLITTSTSANATGYSSQRKIVRTTTGLMLTFVYRGDTTNRICYSVSNADGKMADGNFISTNFGYDITAVGGFDVQIDGSNNVWIFMNSGSAGYIQKLTYSAGTWSNGPTTQIMTNSCKGSLLVKSNGDVWVVTFENGHHQYYNYYNTSAYTHNILTGGTPSADTFFGTGFEATKAVDNDESTRWASTATVFPHWWKYDLGVGVTKIVTKLRVGYYGNAFGTFALQGSNDDSSWTPIYSTTSTGTGTGTVWEEWSFSNSTAYRYYRIYVTAGRGDGIVSLYEVQMMESSVTPYWVGMGTLATTFTPTAGKILEVNGDIWAIYQSNGQLLYRIYSSTKGIWGAETVIAASGTTDAFNVFGAAKISDSSVWACCSTSTGIKAYKWNGSTWDSGTLISAAGCIAPCVTVYASTKLVVHYLSSTGALWNNIYTGGSWLGPLQLSTDTNDALLSAVESTTVSPCVLYTQGASSPYNMYFETLTIGSSAYNQGLLNGSQRKILKTSSGKLIMFYVSTDTIHYATSDNDGASWGAWATIGAVTSTIAALFDVQIDSADNIHVVYRNQNYVYYKKLTYSAGNWSNGTEKLLIQHASPASIVIKANGEIWVLSYLNPEIQYVYSTDGGANFSVHSQIAIASNVQDLKVIEVGTDLWAFYIRSTGILAYSIYTSGAWGAENVIMASGAGSNLGVNKIANNNIWVAVGPGGVGIGIRAVQYNGSTWSSLYTLSSNQNDQWPAVGNISGQPLVAYNAYGTNRHIWYRKFNGTTFDTAVQVTDGGTVDYGPTIFEPSSPVLYLAWMKNDGIIGLQFYRTTLINSTQQNLTSDASIIALGTQNTIVSDAKIKALGIAQTISSDAFIDSNIQHTIFSDAKILVTENQQNLLSDAKISTTNNATLTSDAAISIAAIQNNILSDANIVEELTVDAISIFNMVKGITINISNNFVYTQSILSNIVNRFNSCKFVITNIANDFRAKKKIENDIHNDCRFILAAQQYQTPAGQRLQSLGKEYVHVYINGSDQTNVDIDSIRISKTVNAAHLASFELATTYDSTPPAMESLVTIYYSGWLLYRGYVRKTSSVESPEHIVVECESKITQENEHNKYFHIGHQPQSNLDLYYETIQKALTTEFGWNLDIGNFTPSVINVWGTKEAEALTELIQTCGNYGWYYDENENRILWTGGAGRVVNLHRQELGENLDLYDILNHRLDTNIDAIVNKYIVVMGTFTQTKEYQYSLYNYAHYDRFALPTWDRNFEIPSWVNSSGEGYDYNTDPEKYRDVFKVYDLPYLNPQLESYTDEFPPYLRIWADDPIWNGTQGVITDGFTIDYANGKLIFSEPVFSYNPYYNTYGAPIIQVLIWAKQLVTFTASQSVNPEEETNSPLKFITNKVGSYSETVTEILSLPECDIRYGFSMYVDGRLAAYEASWDDTDYAKDYAYWQLSKVSEPKISGDIDVTLDCACFNNINLACRIFSSGITAEPMNIMNISYDLSSFKVSISVENIQPYKRIVSKPTHAGEF